MPFISTAGEYGANGFAAPSGIMGFFMAQRSDFHQMAEGSICDDQPFLRPRLP
jgi:hypothetical protein